LVGADHGKKGLLRSKKGDNEVDVGGRGNRDGAKGVDDEMNLQTGNLRLTGKEFDQVAALAQKGEV